MISLAMQWISGETTKRVRTRREAAGNHAKRSEPDESYFVAIGERRRDRVEYAVDGSAGIRLTQTGGARHP